MTLIGRSFRAGVVVFSVAPLAASLMLGQIVLSYAADPFSLYCMQRLVDSISASPQNPFAKDAVLWIVLLAVATLFLDYVTFIGSLQVIGIQRKLNLGLTERIQAKFRRMDYACFEDPSVNDVIERMGAEPQQKFFRLFQGMTDIVGCVVATIGLTTVVAQASSALAFVLLGVIILMLFFEFKRIEMQVGLEQSQTSEERKMDYLSDLLGNKRSLFELRVFGAVDYIRLKWKMHADVVIDERMHTAIHAQKYHALNATCYVVWMAAVMVVSVGGLFDRSMSLGVFVALVGTMRSLSNMYGTMNMAFSNIARNHLEIANYDRFMSFPEHPASDEVSSVDVPTSPFRIEFDDVTFSYPGIGRRILDGVTFSIEPGELVALVGCNGAGKSTIVKLLARLYKPDAGEIRIGGIPLADLSQAAYTKALSFVFQDFMRYKLTLREGVGLGCTAKMDDDVALCDALQRGLFCRPDEKVDLDCNLGKLEADGVDLSGGQWQRLAISRALVAGSRFVVLDEPTASFDPIAESKLYRSFAAAMQNRGCLMISHRLASARMCSKIVVLDKGRVVACGSHDMLMSQEGLYRRMFEAQAAWYVETDADKDADAFNSVERTDAGEHI